MADVDFVTVETDLADAAFMYAISLDASKDSVVETMHAPLSEQEHHAFHGIRIGTSANGTSVISQRQYDGYSRAFGLRRSKSP